MNQEQREWVERVANGRAILMQGNGRGHDCKEKLNDRNRQVRKRVIEKREWVESN